MTQAVNYDIVGSYNNQRVSGIDAERTVNLFQYNDPLGKKPSSLLSTSGLLNTNLVFGNTIGGFRGQFVFNDNMYVVIGSDVYVIDSALAPIRINSLPLNTFTGYVGIDANNAQNPQVIFVDGINGYIWDTIALTWTMITDTSFPAQPIDVCYLDGFFVVANGNTNEFQLSELNQGLVWGPASNVFTTDNGALPNQLIIGASNLTDGAPGTPNYQTGVSVSLTLGSGGSLSGSGLAVATTYYVILIDSTHIKLATSYANATAPIPIPITLTGDVTPVVNIVSDGQLQEGAITSHPGNIVACRTLHRQLFLFSENYTEVWENAGIGTNLPFLRNNSLLMEFGTPSIASIRTGFDKMFFLSQDKDGLGAVMMVTGSECIPVSTRALDYALAQYASTPGVGVADAWGVLIKENGIIFYRLNFTKANHTYVYDVTQSDPSQEQTKLWHEEEVLNGDRHPMQTHGYFQGINYAGHYSSPIMYVVDVNLFTNDGEDIHRMRIGRPLYTNPGYQRTRIDRFQLDLLQGTIQLISGETVPVDLTTENSMIIDTEDGNDIILEQGAQSGDIISPVVFLSISKDGGQSYGFMLQAPMGQLGQRQFRTVWRKLGMISRGQTFVPKIEFFNPSPFVVFGAAWAMEVEPE
jgi:hypothetical protein